MARNVAIRNKIAQDQAEINFFNMQPQYDEDIKEYLKLKRRIVLARLRQEVAALDAAAPTPAQ
ncbi:hypothetical protein JG687_00015373 [Phytophthora cactorum]|uniref:Uncharacterized protein n=1 Tax=Phytophthora cactorum TaxID=29920 RepID=A0A329SBH5_9STRA|nr:hypothetical protein Pcac1_g18179 [Phytophthora cactorum]KAG2824914.1 hypothetical protein PC111_g9603 [Phytophthora cactorum]KAG2842282.1 hypothetical protein PC112_g3065 [Phytophthora cactorum]KAG2861357.1 hypothetical protein PC113_g7268 [Phytophthora cactorum]KAG2922683.1 hypothetical protein PC114_g5152 [Phytophthora cactorum]